MRKKIVVCSTPGVSVMNERESERKRESAREEGKERERESVCVCVCLLQDETAFFFLGAC
jgi:hypothetical protein